MAKFNYGHRYIIPKEKPPEVPYQHLTNQDLEKHGIQVLISSYNCAHYLKKCLDSVQAALKGYKWILVFGDDASTDETVQLVESYQLDVDFIFLKTFKKAKNAAQAKNRIVQEAIAFADEYPWLCFMDADDEMGVERITKLLPFAVAHQEQKAVVFGDYMMYKESGNEYCRAEEEMAAQGRLGPWATLIHVSMVEKNTPFFPEELNAYEDSALWLLWLHTGVKFVPINGAITHHYYIRKGSVANPASAEIRKQHQVAYEKFINEHIKPKLSRKEVSDTPQ